MGQSKKTRYYLDLRTDYGFKYVLGENKELLISLLNEFLHDIIEKITDVVYLPTEQLGFNTKEKKIVFDLYCEDQSLNRIVIEMQRKELDYYVNRILYYMSRSLSKSVKRGDLKYRMQKSLSLHLLDYKSVWFERNRELVQIIQLKDNKNRIFSEKVSIVLVNLCIFAARKKMVTFPGVQHKWVYLLKNMRKMTLEDEARETDPIFRKLYEVSRLSNLNTEEMEEYRKSVLEYEDVQNAIECASRKSEARGEARGRKAGLAEGEARGRKAGLAEGEASAKRVMAFEMLKKGIPHSLVSEISGLSDQEVLALAKES